jgi:hypothetical protein
MTGWSSCGGACGFEKMTQLGQYLGRLVVLGRTEFLENAADCMIGGDYTLPAGEAAYG